MNDDELFEAELSRLKPGQLPKQLLVRLTAHALDLAPQARPHLRSFRLLNLLRISLAGGRWLAPAAALAIGLGSLLLLHFTARPTKPLSHLSSQTDGAGLKASNVEIDRRLLASFDAIARLPNGAPVRLRCREWADQVRVVDSTSGVIIEQTQPRLEVVPVKFEVY